MSTPKCRKNGEKLAAGIREAVTNNLNAFSAMTGRSRDDIARDLDMPYTTICAWFNGSRFPRIEYMSMLAEYFGVSVHDIMDSNTTKDVLTEQEAKLVQQYRSMTPNQKAQLRMFIALFDTTGRSEN